MIKRSLMAALAVALAACNPAGPRAPAHPSQSQATATGTTQQVQISAANRAEVENNIRELLTQSATQFASGGVPIAGVEDALTAIQPGTDHQYPVELTAGSNYIFVGVCDADCTNVDLELLDGATGAVVGSDLLDDDYPVVQYTPTANATYFVRLILRTCTQAPCYVGARGLTTPVGAK